MCHLGCHRGGWGSIASCTDRSPGRSPARLWPSRSPSWWPPARAACRACRRFHRVCRASRRFRRACRASRRCRRSRPGRHRPRSRPQRPHPRRLRPRHRRQPRRSPRRPSPRSSRRRADGSADRGPDLDAQADGHAAADRGADRQSDAESDRQPDADRQSDADRQPEPAADGRLAVARPNCSPRPRSDGLREQLPADHPDPRDRRRRPCGIRPEPTQQGIGRAASDGWPDAGCPSTGRPDRPRCSDRGRPNAPVRRRARGRA